MEQVPRASTKFVWQRVIVAAGSAPAGCSAEGTTKGRRYMQERRLREPLTIEVKYRGGSRALWSVKFRGTYRTFDGGLCLHDVLSALYEERWVAR